MHHQKPPCAYKHSSRQQHYKAARCHHPHRHCRRQASRRLLPFPPPVASFASSPPADRPTRQARRAAAVKVGAERAVRVVVVASNRRGGPTHCHHLGPVRKAKSAFVAGRRDHAFTSAIVNISTRQRRTKTTVLGICCACGAELFALGHSGVVSFCCPCFFFGRGLQTAPFACFLSGVRDGWTARFSRYLAALPPLGAWNSTSQLWVYQLVINFVGHSTEWTSERRWYRIVNGLGGGLGGGAGGHERDGYRFSCRVASVSPVRGGVGMGVVAEPASREHARAAFSCSCSHSRFRSSHSGFRPRFRSRSHSRSHSQSRSRSRSHSRSRACARSRSRSLALALALALLSLVLLLFRLVLVSLVCRCAIRQTSRHGWGG